jgi:hypothetical protein
VPAAQESRDAAAWYDLRCVWQSPRELQAVVKPIRAALSRKRPSGEAAGRIIGKRKRKTSKFGWSQALACSERTSGPSVIRAWVSSLAGQRFRSGFGATEGEISGEGACKRRSLKA